MIFYPNENTFTFIRTCMYIFLFVYFSSFFLSLTGHYTSTYINTKLQNIFNQRRREKVHIIFVCHIFINYYLRILTVPLKIRFFPFT